MARAKSTTARKSKPRAPRRTRADYEELLLRTADTELLKKRHPGESSIRDIAKEAQVHHRFIATWFGGKTQLLTVVGEATKGIMAARDADEGSSQHCICRWINHVVRLHHLPTSGHRNHAGRDSGALLEFVA